MQSFWLDSDVFIQAKRIYYPFDIFPGFWAFLDRQIEAQTIKSPYEVFIELCRYGDQLSDWARGHRDRGFFREPDDAVQQNFTDIADYVQDTYEEAFASKFLSDADPWVIAHAKTDGGTVVTIEKIVGQDSKRVKIPNVCREFDVPFIDTFEMLRELGASFDV
jgi:hypothetical protein